MSFVIAAAAVTGGVGAYKAISGAKQVRDGKRMAANNIRSVYTRPGEVTTALNIAERNYLNGDMPGSGQLRNDISTNQSTAFANAAQGASSSGDVLDAATKINYNSNIASNNLAGNNAQYKIQALNNYTNQLNNSAQYTDKEFSYNKDQPYQQTAAAASALIGAGNQNIFSGINDIGGAAVSALGTMGGAQNPDVSKTAPVTSSLPASMPPTFSSSIQAYANPLMTGKMIVDPTTGQRRWVSN